MLSLKIIGKTLAALLMGLGCGLGALVLVENLVPVPPSDILPVSDMSVLVGLFTGTLGAVWGWKDAADLAHHVFIQIFGRLVTSWF